jgi:hypothetical protein
MADEVGALEQVLHDVTAQEIEADREKWQCVIDELNKDSSDVTYELRQATDEGYYYIAPVLRCQETRANHNNGSWKHVEFSDKQFGDDYFAWMRHPESDFILDMTPSVSKNPDEYVGRFSYHPTAHEMLLGRISQSHASLKHKFGNHEFNEYQRGIYVKPKRLIMIRPYYNPLDENGEFDPYKGFDKVTNDLVTELTITMLEDNNMPPDIRILKNVNNDDVKEHVKFFV